MVEVLAEWSFCRSSGDTTFSPALDHLGRPRWKSLPGRGFLSSQAQPAPVPNALLLLFPLLEGFHRALHAVIGAPTLRTLPDGARPDGVSASAPALSPTRNAGCHRAHSASPPSSPSSPNRCSAAFSNRSISAAIAGLRGPPPRLSPPPGGCASQHVASSHPAARDSRQHGPPPAPRRLPTRVSGPPTLSRSI